VHWGDAKIYDLSWFLVENYRFIIKEGVFFGKNNPQKR
jgi:hypothetical protein